MKSDDERHHVEDEKLLNSSRGMRGPPPPKLRKNIRLEKRWGPQYYAFVKEAVFVLRANPHMPAEPPLSVREEADDCQPLHVCHTCKDCFRFPSSLEAHKSRRSWILGYWCHNCFFIDCTHTQKGQPPCFDCQAINRQRTTFLKAKGLRKGRKMGAIKIFYNQCQYFSHLRSHKTGVVDMADVMLMPLPVDEDKECFSELEQLCEIIMERMFLTRRHILDWLKSQQLGNRWWNFLRSNSENNEGPLAQLLAGNVGGKKPVKRPVKPQNILNHGIASPGAASPGFSPVNYPLSPDTESSISETIESVIAQSSWNETTPTIKARDPKMPPLTSITYMNPLEPVEDDDNPCTTADIAFVDCGPAARTYPPDVAIVLPAKDKFPIIKNGTGTSCSSVVNVVPVKADSHPPLRVSRTPIILKQRSADKNLHTATSTSPASPASQRPFEPKISVKKFANERLKSISPLVNCQKSYSRLNNQKPQPLRKLAPASSVRIPSGKTTLPSVMEIARVVETSKKSGAQASLSKLAPKIVTVHSPKSSQLSKIISQLPPEVINGKKIVFIGQDAERYTILPKNDTMNSSLGMIKIPCDTDKAKIVVTHPAKIAPKLVSNNGSEQSVRIAQTETSQKSPSHDKTKSNIQPVFLDGKVIYQNGKKFIIRHARKPIPDTTVCTNINNLKLQTVPKRVSLSTFLSQSRIPGVTGITSSCLPIAPKSVDNGANKHVPPLAPCLITSSPPSPHSSPSPSLSPSLSISEDPIGLQSKAETKRNRNDSENLGKLVSSLHSSESSVVRDVHNLGAVEYFTIEKNEAGKSYVDFSKSKVLNCTQTAAYYKQQMRHNSRHLGLGRIKQQIEHLMEVNAEYSRMLGVTTDARISDNLRAIKALETVLEEEPVCLDQDENIDRGSSADDIDEIWSNLTETRETTSTCSTCNKSIKSRVLESSKQSVKSSSCHSCSNYVCHICDVYQGNLSRFRAHLNYHAKKEPFTCPDCLHKFPSFKRLEIHTWTTCFHILARRWFKCKVCRVEGFLNMDSVTKHFILAHSRLKIACPECGIHSESRSVFQKHCEEDHPTATNQLKPVHLMQCDVGNCVVRIEDFRSHMDHHTAVTNMLYYKCTYCPFLTPTVKRSREQIKSHVFNKHADKLTELGFENFHLKNPKLSMSSEDNTQNDFNTNLDDVSISNLPSERKDEDKEVVELGQGPSVSESEEKNPGTSDDAENNSQADDQSSSDYLDAKLTKESLKDGVECSVWSINLGNTESPGSLDLGSESLQIMTTDQEDGNTSNNVISEYSSSPKIFDVRSVTPDSYAEFGGVTKDQIDVSAGIYKEGDSDGFLPMNMLDSRDHSVVSDSRTKETLLIKMGEQLVPMQLPQVIVLNETGTDVNLTQMLQSTWATSNTFVKLSDLTKSDAKTERELTNKNPRVSVTKESAVETVSEQCDRITVDSTTSRKLPVSSSSRKQILPVSVLKSNNSSIEIIRNDITEPNNCVSDVPQNITDTWGEKMRDSLLFDVSKPPPLSRIPQHLLQESQVEDEVEEEEEEEDVQETKEVTTPKSMVKSRPRHKRPWRIAFNGPICSSEIIDYHCHLCGELIDTSWSVLRNHFSSRHSQDYKLAVVTPRLLRMSSDFISEGYKEVLGSKKRKSDGMVPSSKRRRRWNPRKHVEKHPLDPGLCVRQESVQDGEGNFICKKCDQQCNDISSLRTHIGTHHRIKDHYLVCLECGENFVVEPSLQMHLKAFHCIQDPCAYLAQNTAYAKKFIETVEEESSTGIANQCHVCMAVFEDKLAVDKHLRVHGMAFLNRKRIEAQKAARNPEKKSKVDKPDDSLMEAAQDNEKLENLELDKIEAIIGTVRES